MSKVEAKQISIRARLENWVEGMDYCAISVPKSVTKTLQTHGPVAGSARINGCDPFLVSLFTVGGGRHYVRIRARVRKAAKVKEGDRVHFQFPAFDQFKTLLPKDLESTLQAQGLLETFSAYRTAIKVMLCG